MQPEWGKWLILVGLMLVAVGILAALNLLSWAGKLPGDIVIKKENFSFHFPIVSCLLLSLILTFIFQWFRK